MYFFVIDILKPSKDKTLLKAFLCLIRITLTEVERRQYSIPFEITIKSLKKFASKNICKYVCFKFNQMVKSKS